MKKIVIGLLATTCSFASLAKDYGAAGCGVGAILFDGQSGLGPHVLAATTNGFYGTQTFAMSSGTLGCDVNSTIQSHAALNLINGNMDSVAVAIATGEGEALVALADSFSVQDADREIFYSALKNNFKTIYGNQDVTGTNVYSAIIDTMKAKAELTKYVS